MSKKKHDDDADDDAEAVQHPAPPPKPGPKATEQPVYELGEGSTPDPDQPAYPIPPA